MRRRRVALQMNLDWPYKRHTAVYAGAQQYAQEHDWLTSVDEYIEDTIVQRSHSVPYDGMIARASSKLAVRAKRLKIPVVNVWISSPAWKRLPSVFADSAALGQLRAEHLLSRGLHRFASLTFQEDRSEELELRAFLAVLKARKSSCDSIYVPLDSCSTLKSWRKMERIISRWMDRWELPIGVYVGAEMPGRLVAQECLNRGWRIPQDVAIITGRNEEALCQSPRPTLSSVEVGFERIGYEAARLLDQLMNGKKPPAQPILIPPQGVVIRESTDFFAVDDELVTLALRFISANFHREISPEDVARAVSIEPRTLHRRFQKFLNRPIATEIRRVRLERAKRELAEGTRSMHEIARDVGFGGATRMYETFRRELGVPPSQYRNERQ